jgi:DtxR family Mn-dependent transcriptional regulator
VVTTNIIAEHLSKRASSVTDMVRKLADNDLVNYTKYQGVTLTSKGEKIAVKIVRKHRLWELFLYQKLGFKWNEIHDIAEELEHIQSDLLVERLYEFLNYPQKDPHGDPIPDELGNFPENKSVPVSRFKSGINGIVVGVNDKSSAFLAYLDKIGIHLGTEIKLIEVHAFDNSVDIKIDELKFIHLSYQAAQNILMVEK